MGLTDKEIYASLKLSSPNSFKAKIFTVKLLGLKSIVCMSNLRTSGLAPMRYSVPIRENRE